MSKSKKNLPLIPLENSVLFPQTVVPLFLESQISKNAIKVLNQKELDELLFVTTKYKIDNTPTIDDFYSVGVLARILQIIKFTDNKIKLLVEITEAVYLKSVKQVGSPAHLSGEYEILEEFLQNQKPNRNENAKLFDNEDYDPYHIDDPSLFQRVLDNFKNYLNINPRLTTDVLEELNEEITYKQTINIISNHLTCSITERQNLLSIVDLTEKMKYLEDLMSADIAVIKTENHIRGEVKKQMEKTQRDYYLNEQLKVIQKELGQDEHSDMMQMEKKINSLKLSPEAKEKAEYELKKLKAMNPMSAESGIVRNYLETLISMPWGKKTKTKIEIQKSLKTLDTDHYGLDKVKERIIEYLSVLQRADKIAGPILCLVGPPGVGKTSLAHSIAKATGRKYTKFSLGGLRDEAEIRGHRRTYIGAIPGKIITLIKKSKTDNPVMLLDEIDKLSKDYRNDPSSSLLEVLDPEQNKNFVDHYLEVEYDLSDIMFIATANSLNIPRPLLDRMEIIRIDGYLEEEKMQIAKRYLIPKQLKAHSMKKNELKITDDALLSLIRNYTKESGVRNLEREIGALVRKTLKKILEEKIKSITISSNELEEFLGVEKYKTNSINQYDEIGVTTGLAYTEVGGDLLAIEAILTHGKGEIKATGNLGDVMKESSQAAFSCFKSQAIKFNIQEEKYKDKDIHLHVPEGATPKDGPSAGIAIFTSIFSVITGIPVKKTVAMTGEITLRGKVLPIGGLKEKLLAASRGGIKEAIIPAENVKDLKDIPQSIKESMKIIPVSYVKEVLEIALSQKI